MLMNLVSPIRKGFHKHDGAILQKPFANPFRISGSQPAIGPESPNLFRMNVYTLSISKSFRMDSYITCGGRGAPSEHRCERRTCVRLTAGANFRLFFRFRALNFRHSTVDFRPSPEGGTRLATGH